MLLKVTEKILSDRNTCIVLLFYWLHGNIVYIIIVTSLILVIIIYVQSFMIAIDRSDYWWLEVSRLLLYKSMLLKVTGKILSDRNTFIVILFYRLHGIIVHIVIVTLILLLLLFHPSNWHDMDIDCYKW